MRVLKRMRRVWRVWTVAVAAGALALCALVFLPGSSARAQADMAYAAPVTTESQVAMIFHKLSRQLPDFQKWALFTKAYQEAASFDKEHVRKQEAERLMENFRLMNPNEIITVVADVQLSPYSRVKQGYFIESFDQTTFFNYEFLDKRYAVVPRAIEDFLWIEASEQIAEEVQGYYRSQSAEKGLVVTLEISLKPLTADPKVPFRYNNQSFWLIMAEIVEMRLWNDIGRAKLIWQSTSSFGTVRKKLLNLYQ